MFPVFDPPIMLGIATGGLLVVLSGACLMVHAGECVM